MAWASNSIRTSSNYLLAANVPFAEILAGATDYPVITRISFSDLITNDGATYVLGLARSTVVGVPSPAAARPLVTPYSFVDESGSDHSSGVYIATEWTRLPTFGTTYFRRLSFGNGGVGVGVGCFAEWTFPGGLKMLPNTSLVIASLAAINAASTPMLNISVEIDA